MEALGFGRAALVASVAVSPASVAALHGRWDSLTLAAERSAAFACTRSARSSSSGRSAGCGVCWFVESGMGLFVSLGMGTSFGCEDKNIWMRLYEC